MRSRFAIALLTLLTGAVSASAQRQWIVHPSSYQGDTWQTVSGGDFDGRNYRYSDRFSGVTRGFWDLTAENCTPVAPNTDLLPVKPGLYAVEQWAPTVKPNGVTSWDWAPIEVTFDGPGSGEEATRNLFIPWNGQYSTNHQWIGSQLGSAAGTWVAAGPGPQAPANATCAASGSAPSSLQMWMKRGSTLYMKWNFPFEFTSPLTAVRLTEVHWDSATCGTPALGGPVDLRCVGNADPVYGLNEPFANDDERRQDTTSIDGDYALAANSYTVWVCLDPGYPYNVPLTPGLPSTGLYTAKLANRNIDFKINYTGLNTLKWRSAPDGEFAESRIVTLNQSAGREFVPGNYANLHFLTVSSGARGHRLAVQAVYQDGSTETDYLNLYDWFGNSGDETAAAVGVNGVRRAAGGQGLKRLSRYGDSVEHGGGGDANGAFMFAHTVAINACKTLTRVNISTDFRHAAPYVVESRSGGQNNFGFSASGGWTNDAAKSTVNEVTPGIGSLYAGAGSGSTATFSFTPTVSAYYEVLATWARDLDAATQAAFTITSDAAPATMFRNQRQDGNSWQGLGSYPMTAGNTYTVTLNASLSSGGPRVYADAIRWVTPGITTHVLAATFETGPCVNCNIPWADADGDRDVDMADFAALQNCLTTGAPGLLPGCECVDSNEDGSIDLDDLAAFAACALGPAVEYVHEPSPPYWPNWPEACPGQPAQ